MSPLPRRVVAGYAAGSVGTGGFGTLPGLLLAYYLTDSLGVAAGLAGLAVVLPKVWDVLIDPFVGHLSDTRAARTGTRRGLMLAGALSLPVLFAATFAVPTGLSPAASTAWVVVCFVGAATAFSLFQVPYIGLPAELTGDYDARTRLVAVRVAVLAVAILLFGAGGPALRDLGGGGAGGYLLMGVVAGAVIGLGMLGTWWGVRGHERVGGTRRAAQPPASAPPEPATSPGRTTREGLAAGVTAVRSSRPFRLLLTAFVLQALATGAMLAGAQYVATYVIGQESAVSLLFAALVAPALLVMPAWAALAGRVGKERSFLLASVLFAVAAGSLLLLAAAPGPWVYVSVAAAGVAYAGMQAFPLAMLPDVVSHHARHDPAVRTGSFSGVWTAGETAGLAVGPALVLGVLALTGFEPSRAGQVVAQPDGAVLGIVVAFSVLPALLVLASLLVLRRYPLRRRDIEQDELRESAA